jgi:hypothetical protein
LLECEQLVHEPLLLERLVSADDRLLKLAIEAKKEKRSVDFKASFDPHDHGACCEVIKDIAAMANSGGGVLIVGVNDNGTANTGDLSALLSFDVSNLTNKIHSFTGSNFADVETHSLKRGSHPVAAIRVGPADSPLVFGKDGSYPDPSRGGAPKFAFRAGVTYFRHGAKSVPATTEDLKDTIHKRVEAARKEMLRNVKQAASAPSGSSVHVVNPGLIRGISDGGLPVRVVTDLTVPTIGLIDYEKRNPYRQKDLVEAVKKLLPPGTVFTAHDAQGIRRIHDTDGKEEFSHRFQYGGRQYSDAFAKWIASQVKADKDFLTKTRDAYRDYFRQQSKGPWTTAKKKK